MKTDQVLSGSGQTRYRVDKESATETMTSSLIPGRIKPNIGMIGIQFLCLTFSFKRDNVVPLNLGG